MKVYFCLLEKFNNYFNRKVIRYDILDDYLSGVEDFFIPSKDNDTFLPFDFNPNDNVSTEVIINDLEFEPDYMLVLDSDNNILSRWFVLSQNRNRLGQWVYSLRRDVIADNIEPLMTAPVFVQKGIVPDTNALVLNPEGMNFNQIKTEETLLRDSSESSWLVAYIAKNFDAADLPVDVPTIDIENYYSLSTIASDLGITEAQLAARVNVGTDRLYKLRFTSSLFFSYSVEAGLVDTKHSFYSTSNASSIKSQWQDVAWNPSHPLYNLSQSGSSAYMMGCFGRAIVANKTQIMSQILTLTNEDFYLENSQLSALQFYNGKIVKYLGKYYKVNIVANGSKYQSYRSNFAYATYTSLKKVAEDADAEYSQSTVLNPNGRYDEFGTVASEVYFVLEEITDSDTIPQAETQISTNRKVTEGQQFDMFCIPADQLTFYFNNGTYDIAFQSDPDIARRIINEVAIKKDANVYDIQLLPYCPISKLLESKLISGTEHEDFDYITVGSTSITLNLDVQSIDYPAAPVVTPQASNIWDVTVQFVCQTESGKAITIDSLSVVATSDTGSISNESVSINNSTGLGTLTYRYTTSDPDQADDPLEVLANIEYSYSGTSKVGILFYCQQASFQTLLNYPLAIKDSMKVDSQCDMYRLVSPNYQGTFEFNVAKNGGSVDFFTAYCTYKPYTPFIKVVPNFSFVYGMDYNDNRGLICGGDFSLPRVSSAWENYQLNNKNYQNIFNRDIQNLDFTQSLEARQQYISGGVGIFNDAVKGGIAGGMIGGGWGAAAGAVLGAGVSLAGYSIDNEIMAKRHKEAKDYAVDKFNYQLGNIKALPYTLTKVGAFDISSKVFPFLEYYTCSDAEKDALREKIKFESMTIMAIGLFGDYYQAFDEPKYFKGELIRCDEFDGSPNVLEAIYAELLKGVYM
jgi:hypothetical protein